MKRQTHTLLFIYSFFNGDGDKMKTLYALGMRTWMKINFEDRDEIIKLALAQPYYHFYCLLALKEGGENA